MNLVLYRTEQKQKRLYSIQVILNEIQEFPSIN